MAYTFDKANANAPSPHKTQYFEMMGVQGLYNDGWMLSAVPMPSAVETCVGKAIPDPASSFKFELYDLSHDWTQYDDVAAAKSEQGQGDDGPDVRRVREISGAAARCLGRRRAWSAPRPSHRRRAQGVHLLGRPVTGIPQRRLRQTCSTPPTPSPPRSTCRRAAREGMIADRRRAFRRLRALLAEGQAGLHLEPARPEAGHAGKGRTRWPPASTRSSTTSSMTGSASPRWPSTTLSGIGRGGTGTFKVDGKVVATQTMERTIPILLPMGRDVRHRLGYRHAGR